MWNAERFSEWTTMLPHKFHAETSFEARVQCAELEYPASSHSAQMVLAENYVGLRSDLDQ